MPADDRADDRHEGGEERDDHDRDDEAAPTSQQGEADDDRFDDTQERSAAEVATGGVPAPLGGAFGPRSRWSRRWIRARP